MLDVDELVKSMVKMSLKTKVQPPQAMKVIKEEDIDEEA
jgi:hypothetical protein